MRESCAELEKLVTTFHTETIQDRTFLASLLEHKYNTITWLRERKDLEIANIAKLYDDMIITLGKEVVLVEEHLKTFGE